MPVAEGDKLSTEVQKLPVSVLPVEPGKLVVLTVGIVVATLRMAEFVTVPHHGDALAHQEGRYQRAPAALAYLEDRRVVGRAFRAAVPRAVVVSSVVVVLAVRLVVLAVVGDQVGEGEPVMRGDEIDAGVGAPPGPLVQVGAAGQPVGEIRQGVVSATPVVTDGVAVAPVPLRPQGREVAHLVAALADVPGLGDELDLAHHRVHLNEVEERGQAVDLVELAGQAGREVEPEAVHMHLGHPVAQRVDDQLQHVRVPHVQRVPGAGGVEVVAPAVGKPVVRAVVDPFERQHRAEVIALRGVVVDDVEDDLDPGFMQGLHQVPELGDDLCDTPRRVLVVRGEEADRVVSPVVTQAAVDQVVVVDELMDRHQLHRGDAQAAQVLDHGRMRQAGVGTPQFRRDLRTAHAESFDMALIQHGLVPGDPQRAVITPLKPGVDDHRPGNEGRAVRVVADAIVSAERVAIDGAVPSDLAVQRLGVGVLQQLGRIAPQSRIGVMRSVYAVTVALSRTDSGKEAVPDVSVCLGQVQPLLVASAVVEQA